MFIISGLVSLARHLSVCWFNRQDGIRRVAKRSAFVTGVETLESRQLLTNFTVTTALDDSTTDSGLSLREAINAANASSGADTISFASNLTGQRILLTQGQLVISDPLTITGLGATNTVVDAQLDSRVFRLTQSAGDVTFDGLTVTGGRTNADASRGAGVYSYSSGTLTLSNSTVTANATFGTFSQGGGVFSFLGPIALINSTVSGNSTSGSSAPGGGIASNVAPITLVNSTISGNVTQGSNSSGAGIATYSGNVKLVNTTVAFNSATGSSAGGGGLFSGVTSSQGHNSITLNNSIIAKNTTSNSTAVDFFQGTGVTSLSVNSSLIGNNTGSTLVAAPVGSPDSSGNLIGTSAQPIDPKLGALAINGGTTKTHALLSGSPAVDAGDNSLAIDLNNSLLTTDQNGQPRIIHGIVDMGSTEGVNAAAGTTVSFNVASQSVSESAGVVTLTVNLSSPSTQQISIPFTVSGTATNSADYTIISSPLIIPANATTGSIQISIVDDATAESNETVVVTLGTPTNATLGSLTTETLTIIDNDGGNGGSAPTNITLSPSTVPENSPNVLVGTLTATDPNPGDTATFSIQPGGQGSKFVIVGNQLKVGSAGLDFESLPQGTALVTVRATDNTGLFLDKTLSITVTNTNDAPVIPTGQALSVAENAPAGTVVGTVIATDQDLSAPNNTLTYQIAGGNTNNAFTINSATGQVTVANPAALNAYSNPHFNLLVTVSDGGTPSLSTTQIVRVDVGSVNHAPSIPSGQSFTITEQAASNSFVGDVIATDPDSTAPNGILTYSIISGNANSAFTINSTNGIITVNNAAALNSSTTPLYTLLVRVTDGGSPSLSATQNVAIHVISTTSSNHAPSIPPFQIFTVSDTAANNMAVGTVIATDPDPTAPNNTLTYSIVGNNTNNAFAINSTTGLITINNAAALNAAFQPFYPLLIRVSDGGSPSLSAIQNVTIHVVHISTSNHSPSIPSGQSFTLPENSAVNTVVGTVIATDPDVTAPNNTLTYSIIGGNAVNAFTINSVTGQITVLHPSALNFETTPQFTLTIKVTDGGSPALSATRTVRIYLTDVNEPPTIPAGQVFTVPENSTFNTLVGTVIATDPDIAATNRTLAYSITGGNTDQAFAINPANGQITVSTPSAINMATNPTFLLIVKATDGGGLSASQSVVVNVTGPNQAPMLVNFGSNPVYHRGASSIAVLPNITVTDPDSTIDLAQVIISVSIPSGRKNLDQLNTSALSAMGTVSTTNSGGRHQITVNLRAGVTTDQVQNALRSVKFSTSGTGLNQSNRDVQVQVIDRHGASSSIVTQGIIVSRKTH
jgi:hypothetical protein